MPDAKLSQQCHLLLGKLESLQNSKTPVEQTNAKILIHKILSSKEKKYLEIEMIMQAVVVTSTKFSVESVLESIVSRYENHFDRFQTVGEEIALDEIEISINGPNPAHCDSVVRAAMNTYWNKKISKDWHFVRTTATVDHMRFNVSKVLNR